MKLRVPISAFRIVRAVVVYLRSSDNACLFHDGGITDLELGETEAEPYKLIILTSKVRLMNETFSLKDTWLPHVTGRETDHGPAKTVDVCRARCDDDALCDLYNYCERSGNDWCSKLTNNCRLISIQQIRQDEQLEHKEGAHFELFG